MKTKTVVPPEIHGNVLKGQVTVSTMWMAWTRDPDKALAVAKKDLVTLKSQGVTAIMLYQGGKHLTTVFCV